MTSCCRMRHVASSTSHTSISSHGFRSALLHVLHNDPCDLGDVCRPGCKQSELARQTSAEQPGSCAFKAASMHAILSVAYDHPGTAKSLLESPLTAGVWMMRA